MNITPPPISPRQMNMLRVVLSMAWSDSTLEQKEVEVMLTRFSQLFATDPDQQDYLQAQLKEYFVQDVPLEETVGKLTTNEEKEVALRLSCEVINASARTPDESAVNEDESEAYRQLVELLDLPEAVVERAEEAANATLSQGGDNIIDMLAFRLREQLTT